MEEPATRAIFESDLVASWDTQKNCCANMAFYCQLLSFKKSAKTDRAGMSRYLIHTENAHNGFPLINIRFQTNRFTMASEKIYYLLQITIAMKQEIEC